MTPLATLSVLATNFRKLRFLQNELSIFPFSPCFFPEYPFTFEKLLTIGSGNKLLHKQQMKFGVPSCRQGKKKEAFQECSKKTLQRVN